MVVTYPRCPCLAKQFIHPETYFRVNAKIVVDKLLRVGMWDIKFAAKPMRTHAIENAEVDNFCLISHVACDPVDGYSEHACSRLSVNINVIHKGLAQSLVAGDMSKNPKFDLRVIRRQKDLIWFVGNKRASDFAS